MYMYEETTGTVLVRGYFMLLIFIGSMFLVNLALAVITNEYAIASSLDPVGHSYTGHKY